MLKAARLVLLFVLTGALGIGIAFGLAMLVGMLFPSLTIPVFLIVSLWWIWTGWKYACSLDRRKNPGTQI